MKTEHMIVVRYISPTGEVSATFKQTEGDNKEMGVEVAAKAVNQEVNFSLPIAKAKSVMLMASTDMKVLVNDAKSPTQTIELQAGKPKVWSEGGSFVALFTGDVSRLFVTDASLKLTGGLLQIRALAKA